MAKPASRTPANESHVLVTASASQPRSPLLPLTKRIADCGCNLVETRLAALGQEVVVSALASGSWDAIAKFEATAARLEREEGMRLQVTRTGPRTPESASLPYMIEVVAADKAGVLFELAEFFSSRGIAVEQLNSTRYKAMQTGAEMFTAQITVGIPAKTHIAALRDDFLEFCDSLNLDAIMDPIKY
jgi:glycine cleavage system transcriptional repressor